MDFAEVILESERRARALSAGSSEASADSAAAVLVNIEVDEVQRHAEIDRDEKWMESMLCEQSRVGALGDDDDLDPLPLLRDAAAGFAGAAASGALVHRSNAPAGREDPGRQPRRRHPRARPPGHAAGGSGGARQGAASAALRLAATAASSARHAATLAPLAFAPGVPGGSSAALESPRLPSVVASAAMRRNLRIETSFAASVRERLTSPSAADSASLLPIDSTAAGLFPRQRRRAPPSVDEHGANAAASCEHERVQLLQLRSIEAQQAAAREAQARQERHVLRRRQHRASARAQLDRDKPDASSALQGSDRGVFSLRPAKPHWRGRVLSHAAVGGGDSDGFTGDAGSGDGEELDALDGFTSASSDDDYAGAAYGGGRGGGGGGGGKLGRHGAGEESLQLGTSAGDRGRAVGAAAPAEGRSAPGAGSLLPRQFRGQGGRGTGPGPSDHLSSPPPGSGDADDTTEAPRAMSDGGSGAGAGPLAGGDSTTTGVHAGGSGGLARSSKSKTTLGAMRRAGASKGPGADVSRDSAPGVAVAVSPKDPSLRRIETSGVFPDWLSHRQDFQAMYSRLEADPAVDAIRRSNFERTDEDVFQIVQWLRRLEIFEHLNQSRLFSLARVTSYGLYKPGQVVCTMVEAGGSFCTIIAGQVSIFVEGFGNVTTLGIGRSFGELPMLQTNFRGALVTATAPTEILSILKSDYLGILRSQYEQELADNIAFIRKFNLFQSWSRTRLLRLCGVLAQRSYPAGSFIIKQGETPTCMFYIKRGGCRVQKTVDLESTNRWPELISKEDDHEKMYDWGQRTATLRTKIDVVDLGPGTYFGEEAILRGTLRFASVIATSLCTCMVLNKKNFGHLMQGDTVSLLKEKSSRYQPQGSLERLFLAYHTRAKRLAARTGIKREVPSVVSLQKDLQSNALLPPSRASVLAKRRNAANLGKSAPLEEDAEPAEAYNFGVKVKRMPLIIVDLEGLLGQKAEVMPIASKVKAEAARRASIEALPRSPKREDENLGFNLWKRLSPETMTVRAQSAISESEALRATGVL